VHTRAHEADIGERARVEACVLSVVEVAAVERDVHRLAIDDLVDLHRLREEPARMEEHQLEWQTIGAPAGLFGAKPDVAMLVVREFGPQQVRRQDRRRRRVGRGRAQARLLGDRVERERHRRRRLRTGGTGSGAGHEGDDGDGQAQAPQRAGTLAPVRRSERSARPLLLHVSPDSGFEWPARDLNGGRCGLQDAKISMNSYVT
jgi:hypothetical protein